MEVKEVLDFVKKLGVGLRHPHSEFFRNGNKDCRSVEPYGFCDFDDENFYHKPYLQFSCHIPGCGRTFETVIEYESHYNSCHCYTCKECNKNLPNYHLLDLHISENHDAFFMAQVKKKPMYKCFLDECRECFMNPKTRRDHCIRIHKFPSDFRFDSAKKIVKNRNGKKEITLQEQMDIVESSENSDKVNIPENKSKKIPEFKGFTFGRTQGRRKPVFYSFSQDLLDSLPES